LKKRPKSFLYYTLPLVFLASGCSSLSGLKQAIFTDASTSTVTPEVAEATVEPSQAGPTHLKPAYNHKQEILEIGTGEFIAQAAQKPKQQIETADGDITLNFQDTDIREFIKVILGDVLGANYIIDSKVGGKVTIGTHNPVAKDDLLPLLDEILAMNNAAVIKTDGLYKIVPKTQAVAGNLVPSVIHKSGSTGYGVRIIPLRFIASQEMQKILEPFVSDKGNLRADKKRNLLIVSGTQQELDLIQDTIDIFDVDWLRGMSMGLYPLDYIDPKTLKEELDSIIGAIEGEDSKDLLGGLVRTVPIERLNSILLISSTATALREVEIWIHRLDRPGDSVGQRLYVYNVQNAKATELADILSQVFKSTGSSGASKQISPELAPGLRPVEISSKESPSTYNSKGATARAADVEEGVALLADNSIEIIADDVRNALVILSTPQEYKMVVAAIKKLDVVPLQVLIEATILEVTLRDNLSYGVNWFFKNTLESRQDKRGVGTLDLGSPGIAALSPGFSYTVLDNAGQVRLAINALQSESDVNVLSSPSLMVLDNQTATINVGDEIPVPTRQSVSTIDSNAPTVNEIQYRKTGVTLQVTPRVNNSGLVTMEIRQEVSSAVTTTTSDIDAPTIQNRLIESVVAINSGETIVLGGLILNTETDTESGIPLLHKIPIIGKLFGTTVTDSIRTELVVLITPRVVRDRQEARDVTDEFRRRLRSLTPLKNKGDTVETQAPS